MPDTENTEAIKAMLETLHMMQEAYDVAALGQTQASKEETTALNNLNRAQKKVDEWFAKQKKDAPRSTDWGQATQRQHTG